MANGKKSFVLYCDLIHAIDHLTTLEKGQLFEHLLEYVNDKNPVIEDRVLLGTWKPLEQQLKRDLKKFESKKVARIEAGRLGGLAKASNAKQELANLAVNGNDTVNGNVNETIKEGTAKAFVQWFNKSIKELKGSGNFKLTDKVKRQYSARVKDGYEPVDFQKAFSSASKNQFHTENNYQYLTPEFFTRADILEKWCNVEEKKTNNAHLFMP